MDDRLTALRQRIDEIDGQLLMLLAERMEVARQVGEVKRCTGQPVEQPERFAQLTTRHKAMALRHGIAPEAVGQIWQAIQQESIRQQQ